MEKKTTLVVVDFQYDFCLLGAPLYVPGSDKALWNISHLIENKKVDRVIFTADWHPANHCSFKRNGGEWNDHCVQFSKGAAIHDLLLYGCISTGTPYEVLTKGARPGFEEYGITFDAKYRTIRSMSIGTVISPEEQVVVCGLEDWVSVYDGDLGIALSDTYTSAVFFKNLSRKQAKLFDGVRQDSGDEFKFVTSAIARYKELGIDPTTKTIIFSNALTFEKALEVREYCRGRIRCAFGIGTNLTNDTGHKPSNIVMKLTSCQMNKNQPVFNCVKLSDDLGKHTGLEQEVEHCMNELGL